jgi:hypothetical protein
MDRKELDPTSRLIDLERDELLIYEKDWKVIHERFGGDCYNKNQPVQFQKFGYITDTSKVIEIGFYNPTMKAKVIHKPFSFSDKELWLYHVLDTDDKIIITDKNSVLVSDVKDVSVIITHFDYYVNNKTDEKGFIYFDDNLIISKKNAVRLQKNHVMRLPLPDSVLLEIDYKEFVGLNDARYAAKRLVQFSKSFKGQNELWAEAFHLWHLKSPKLDLDYYFELNDLDYVSDIHTKETIKSGSLGFFYFRKGNWDLFIQKDKNKIFVVAINEKFNCWKRRYRTMDWEIFIENDIKRSLNDLNLWNEEYYRQAKYFYHEVSFLLNMYNVDVPDRVSICVTELRKSFDNL